MEITIDQLSLRLSGENISSVRAQQIADLTGAALRDLLHVHASGLGAVPAGYRVPELAIPTLRVSADATNDTIAQSIAKTLARAILRKLDIE